MIEIAGLMNKLESHGMSESNDSNRMNRIKDFKLTIKNEYGKIFKNVICQICQLLCYS